MTNINIPAGLFDGNVEFFNYEGNLMGFIDGKVISYEAFPVEIKKIIEADLELNPAANLALEYSGFLTLDQKLEKYGSCKFGGIDSIPDLINNKVNQKEYHDCGFRGNCPMEGIVCSSMTFNDKVLSPFDLKLIRLLATEMTLPVIAEEMQVSDNTLDTKKKELFEIFHAQSRPRLVSLAYSNHLIF